MGNRLCEAGPAWNRPGEVWDRLLAVVRAYERKEAVMIVLGIILLIVGFVAHIPILWTIGVIVVVIGLLLAVLGMVGHGLFGRRHYY